jgi:hypothetical protein
MSTRIRYIPSRSDTNAILVSTQFFMSASGIAYRVYLNMMDNTYEIRQESNDAVASTGTGKSGAGLKSAAKRALVTLGVAFSNEKRGLADESEEDAA